MSKLSSRVAARYISAAINPEVEFYVKDNSPLDLDSDGTLGVPFTQLLEPLGDVHWGRNSLSITTNHGIQGLIELFNDIRAGKHGPDMIKCLDSLERGKTSTPLANNNLESEFPIP